MPLKKYLKKLFKIILGLMCLLIITLFLINHIIKASIIHDFHDSAQYHNGEFHNAVPEQPATFLKFLTIIKRSLIEKRIDAQPSASLPMKLLSHQQLMGLSNDKWYVVKLGHSSFLMKVFGEFWLIDPMFSERASPFSFMGPERYQAPPINIVDLPSIDKVLISHNHYDHLDKNSIQGLKSKAKQFFVPLGVEGDLIKWGIDDTKITSFDWWQEFTEKDTLVAFTPAQHFSGRGLSDRNLTLWGSWVIKVKSHRLFFSGDSGYFDGFKKIGDQYGPFDLTLIETGAYNNQDWADIHLQPEMSVQAHIDLKGHIMLPIHNATFDLAYHPWYEPLQRASKAAKQHNINLSTPVVGEIFELRQIINQRWWHEFINHK